MHCSLTGFVANAAKDEMVFLGYHAELDDIEYVKIWRERELLSSRSQDPEPSYFFAKPQRSYNACRPLQNYYKWRSGSIVCRWCIA